MTRDDLAKRARKYRQAEEKRKSGQSIITKLLQGAKTLLYRGFRKAKNESLQAVAENETAL
jgi:hypothetical protein